MYVLYISRPDAWERERIDVKSLVMHVALTVSRLPEGRDLVRCFARARTSKSNRYTVGWWHVRSWDLMHQSVVHEGHSIVEIRPVSGQISLGLLCILYSVPCKALLQISALAAVMPPIDLNIENLGM